MGEYPDTPEGHLGKNIKAVIAEYERLKTIERTRRGRYNKAAAGKWPGHTGPAYGYRYRGQGKDRTLEIDPDQAEVVRSIFRWYLEGLTVEAVAGRLNEMGVTWPRHNHPNARWKDWYRSRVWRFLTNRRYIGEFTYSNVTVDLPHLAIIDRSTFEAAQEQIGENKQRARRRRVRQPYLLFGRFRCSCGHAMCGHFDGVRSYYVCSRLAPLAFHERLKATVGRHQIG